MAGRGVHETWPPTGQELLRPYVPRLLVDWLRTTPERRWRELDGSLAFVDISGFTRLTERLARKGRIGAEEMSDTLSTVFSGLLSVAYDDGAGLVKWGGDAVLLLFEGEEHAARAARAAFRMRQTLRDLGKVETSAGRVQLRMSVGIHSGRFHFFLVGDPALHCELLISGPDASRTAEVEGIAAAGEVGLSHAAARLLPARLVRPGADGTYLLAGEPQVPAWPAPHLPDTADLDLGCTLSAPVRSHLLGGGGEPEHRHIAVAFVQFSGTDALLRTAGPDRLADALDECVRNVQEATDRHGVTFFETDINADGGKIMLVAGAPTSGGHNEERMLLAARLVLDRPGALPLRIGVNSGPVFSGDFGPSFRRTYSVKGDAINLAARVMGKAAPGQLLATAAALGRSRTGFETEPLAPFMVKGKARPVEAASVGRPLRGEHERADELPLVGREREMAVLVEALDRARARGGTLVELVGEPGIGKSRLVEELRSTATDVHVVAASCDEYESSTPYFPFRTLLREVCGLAPDDAPADVVRRLSDRVAPNDPGLLPWLPLLGIPLDVELPPSDATRDLAEAFRKPRVEEVCVRFLEAVLPTASLVVLDDVHLMDDASADLLARMCDGLSSRPWLVLVTRRDLDSGFVPSAAPGAASTVTVRPAPLDPATVLSLVGSATEDQPLAPHRMAEIAERAGGNPLFLRSLLAAARSGPGAIGAPGERLPDSVEGLITSQIDRLPTHERALLRFAAVLGVTFAETQLRRMLEGEELPTGRATLHRLADFLEPAGHGRFRFRHALIRDAAYEGLSYRRRRDLHGRVGETLEDTSENPEELAELLSLHYFHAGRHDRAWHYSRLAGERARAKYAWVEAAQFFRRAAEVSRRSPDIDVRERAWVLEALGDSQASIGTFSDALSSFQAARRMVGGDRLAVAELLRKEALVNHRMDRVPQALRTVTRGLGMLAGDDLAREQLGSRAQLEVWYAWCRHKQGRYHESLRWADLAMADAEAAEDRAALAEAYEAAFVAHLHMGRTPPRPYGALALELFRELDDPYRLARSLNHLGFAAAVEGDVAGAAHLYARARDAYTRAGDVVGAGSADYNTGDLLLHQGRLPEAEQVLRRVLLLFQSLGNGEWAEAARRELGMAAVRSGRIDEGLAMLARARAELAELKLAAEVVETDAALVEVELARGQWEQALHAADEALPRAVALGVAVAVRALHRHRGRALLGLGRLVEARQALEQALEACAEEGAWDLGGVLVEMAVVARAQGDPDAEDLERRGRQELARQGYVGD